PFACQIFCVALTLHHILLMSFSAHAARYHQYLHSFPTRRSSDLGGRRQGGGSRARTGQTELPAHPEGVAGTASSNSSRLDCRPRDRKSTRLNSSHVSISYAVFCLKKKKERLYYEVQ